MQHQSCVDQKVGEARKRCNIYLLCDFVFPHLEEWTELEAQKAALSEFLRVTPLPPRIQKSEGKLIEKGSHTVESLLEAIQAAVQQHGLSPAIRGNPIRSFFRKGHGVFTRRYFDTVLDTVNDWFPDLVARQSSSNDISMDEVEQQIRGLDANNSMVSPFEQQIEARTEQTDRVSDPCSNGAIREARAIDKELVQLQLYVKNLLKQ